ncbi:sugar phosphate isomerase/epimerase family protein [Dyadobacter fanqingshengii]|uniref:Sugar phosphate isomerase/epimerase n=1 Tax=Dyadobacter fanqingshengii TaxID=2906443 RepID=A0A9X1PC50_9BACT|nr:sugar phosphate isomerase/epimerase [Dyadobacter fanqingshengii]MCF0042489.1 sugar phosphate isomerase/epimerase [Dyadobacter fanqingshengii]USJ34988.1 sugar phosphate isomerase/epimerase [Dyadobacter fanqingshengii]
MNHNALMDRREMIRKSAWLVAAAASPVAWPLPVPRFQLGACDWSVGKSLNPEAFDRAQQIGLQGIQVSYNTSKNPSGLSVTDTLKTIKAASKRTGVKVSSLAIGELNRVPYKSAEIAEEWVWNSVDAAAALGVDVVLLAFFSDGDLRNDEKGKKAVVAKLRKVAPHAEKKGITLGIESYLTAQEHLDMIQAVGSKSVKVYYDFRNAADAGNDVFEEIKMLGKEMICELHMKENGQKLAQGTMDWPKIAEAVKDIGYSGWMQIEGATPPGADIIECYTENRKYLEGLFSFK